MPIKNKDGKVLYKTFGECVISQMDNGKSQESARKICGWLEKKSKEYGE